MSASLQMAGDRSNGGQGRNDNDSHFGVLALGLRGCAWGGRAAPFEQILTTQALARQ